MKELKKKKWILIKLFVGKNIFRFSSTILSGIIANIFIVLIPISLGKYFDFIFGFQSHRAAFLDRLPFNFWSNLQQYLLFLLVLIVFKTFFQYIQRFQISFLGEKFTKELRESLFRQQLKIKTEVYDDLGTGRYLLRHSGDLKSIQNYFTRGIIRFSSDIILLLIALSFLLWLNKAIFLIILIGFFITALFVYLFNKVLFKVSVTRRNTRSGLLSFVSRQLLAVKSIKAFNKESTEIGKYNKRSSSLFNIGIQFQKISNFIYVVVPFMLYLILVAVLYYIFLIKQNGNHPFDSGEMLGFILLFITILPIFRRVLRVATIWELGNISFNKLITVFGLPVEFDSPELKVYDFKSGEIEFKNVTFFYQKESPLFSNLNFIISPNKLNQIKISNGEGKSTLIKLIAGLYRPVSGDILYDRQPLSTLNLKSLRKKITFVSDEFSLLGRSVFETISYSRNKEKLSKAEKMLETFQENIPYNMRLRVSDRVLEGGRNLSKSQIKMLQYVRVALSNKPIIIIDEPIRNLEKNTRKNILVWLESQSKIKTIILLCRSWNHTINNNIIEIN